LDSLGIGKKVFRPPTLGKVGRLEQPNHQTSTRLGNVGETSLSTWGIIENVDSDLSGVIKFDTVKEQL
jgi:hypothetical protein